jgi:hypothetical protein
MRLRRSGCEREARHVTSVAARADASVPASSSALVDLKERRRARGPSSLDVAERRLHALRLVREAPEDELEEIFLGLTKEVA